jgi:hypothetical protein
MPTQALAVIRAKQGPSNTVVIDPSADHPLKPTLLADIKAATAKDVNARKTAAAGGAVKPKPPSGVAKAKPPPESAKTNEKPVSSHLGSASTMLRGSHTKPRRKTPKGWEKDYSNNESASESDAGDEGFSVITHEHADAKT